MYCLHSNTYHYFSIEDAIQSASTAGLEGLEIAAVKGWTEHIMSGFTKERVEQIQKVAKRAGVVIRSMSGHSDLRHGDRLSDFIDNIKLAHQLGCKTIVTSSGEAHFGNELIDGEELLINGIKTALAECEKYEMVMALETHGQYGSGKKLADLIDKINHPLLGIAYDTANVIRHGNVMPEDDIKECAEYVKHVHLKDKTGEKLGRVFTALGKGWIDFDSIWSALDAVGYEGDYSIEIEYFEDKAPLKGRVDKDVYASAEWLRQIGRMH